jgi:predicted nuclease with TOPRIM domain
LKVENAQLQENLQQEVQNGSKALVSGNSNAKAVHLNNVKMELTKLRHEKVQLEGSIREHEKATEKNLNSTQYMYDELKGLLAKLHLLCDSADQNVAPDGQTGHTVKNLPSVDFGLFKMKEMLHECSNMLQLHFP